MFICLVNGTDYTNLWGKSNTFLAVHLFFFFVFSDVILSLQANCFMMKTSKPKHLECFIKLFTLRDTKLNRKMSHQ